MLQEFTPGQITLHNALLSFSVISIDIVLIGTIIFDINFKKLYPFDLNQTGMLLQ
jgi:hypothetical protein